MKEKVSMPSSGAGITRYLDESKSKFKLSPDWVVLLVVLVAFFVWFLHFLF